MCGAIDAERAAGDDRVTLRRHEPTELGGKLDGIPRCRPSPYDRDGRRIEQPAIYRERAGDVDLGDPQRVCMRRELTNPRHWEIHPAKTPGNGPCLRRQSLVRARRLGGEAHHAWGTLSSRAWHRRQGVAGKRLKS